MASHRSYQWSIQWPIIFSIAGHASIFIVAIAMADFSMQTKPLKPAASAMVITMNSIEPLIPKKPVLHDDERKVLVEKKTITVPDELKKVHVVSKNIRQEAPIFEREKSQKLEPEPEPEPEPEKVAKQNLNQEALIEKAKAVGQQIAEQIDNAEIQYRDRVLHKIEMNKFYSKRAKKMRQEGSVNVHFTLNRDGSIQHLKILDETAPSLLKKDALKTIRLAALFPAFPASSTRETWTFKTALNYTLL